MDNWDRDPIWKDKQAKFRVSDLHRAIKEQCCFCNGVNNWSAENDCTSPACPLFVFRPGEQCQIVDGYARATRNKAKAANARIRAGFLHSSKRTSAVGT